MYTLLCMENSKCLTGVLSILLVTIVFIVSNSSVYAQVIGGGLFCSENQFVTTNSVGKLICSSLPVSSTEGIADQIYGGNVCTEGQLLTTITVNGVTKLNCVDSFSTRLGGNGGDQENCPEDHFLHKLSVSGEGVIGTGCRTQSFTATSFTGDKLFVKNVDVQIPPTIGIGSQPGDIYAARSIKAVDDIETKRLLILGENEAAPTSGAGSWSGNIYAGGHIVTQGNFVGGKICSYYNGSHDNNCVNTADLINFFNNHSHLQLSSKSHTHLDTTPTPTTPTLTNSTKTEEDCTSNGGSIRRDGTDTFCKFSRSSCPSGWDQFRSWRNSVPEDNDVYDYTGDPPHNISGLNYGPPLHRPHQIETESSDSHSHITTPGNNASSNSNQRSTHGGSCSFKSFSFQDASSSLVLSTNNPPEDSYIRAWHWLFSISGVWESDSHVHNASCESEITRIGCH